MGEETDIDTILWDEAFSLDDLNWNSAKPNPLFKRLDLEEIIATEMAVG